jgi:hypothetical protein
MLTRAALLPASTASADAARPDDDYLFRRRLIGTKAASVVPITPKSPANCGNLRHQLTASDYQ